MEVTIKFVDFWNSFDENNNYFVDLLSSKYKVTVLPGKSKDVPDILFYSVFGFKHLSYNCIKVYYTGENDVPDFNECDYAMSFHNIVFDDRHFRLPLYATYPEYKMLDKLKYYETGYFDRDFCSLVVSNLSTSSDKRAEIYSLVNAYKSVASGGLWKNNVGGAVEDKHDFIKKYKFNLALENSRISGYVTEKLVQAFAASTVPIYWGSEDVGKEFNKEAFLDISDYDDKESLLSAIKTLDNDKDLYMTMLKAPKLKTDTSVDWGETTFEFLDRIIRNPIKRVRYDGYSRNLHYMNIGKCLIGDELLKRTGYYLSKLRK